jgi:hypothetical protein
VIFVFVAPVIEVLGAKTFVPITNPKLVLALAAVEAPVPPFAIATIPETFVAVPNNVPVIVPAVKFPLASLATIAFAVLAFVAVVAEFATLPAVVIVPLNVPASAIILVVPAAVNLPFASTVKVGIDAEDP